ncbi:MAG TPA: HAMP domain-containing protein [Firmicutes bacterium]|nr:HAMP domain-containing protein [Bacillota bacterium]
MVIVVALGIPALALSQLIQGYFLAAKERELVTKGKEIAGVASDFLEGKADEATTGRILDALDSFVNARVWVIDRTGLIVAASRRGMGMGMGIGMGIGMGMGTGMGTGTGADGIRMGRGMGYGHGWRLREVRLVDEDVQRVLAGEVVVRRARLSWAKMTRRMEPGSAPGPAPEPAPVAEEQQVITVGIPVQRGPEVIGGIILHSPVRVIMAAANQLRRYILYAGLAALAVSLLLGYSISRRISLPIRQMSEAAARMARGDFKTRVEVDPARARARTGTGTRTRGTRGAWGTWGIWGTWSARGRRGRVEGRDDAARDDAARRHGSTGPGDVSPGGVGDEITELARSFNHMAEQLDRIEENRREFVANVSHELRSPLTAIRGFVQALVDGTVEDEVQRQKYLRLIRDEAIRMNRLLSDLLDLSRIESGKVRMELAPVNLKEITDSTLARAAMRAANAGITIEDRVPGPGDLPPVLVDGDRIEQVLTNLIDNAIHATPPGGRITLSAEVVPSPKPQAASAPYVRVSVRDTGKGIPAEDLPFIWERFYKVDKARSRAEGVGTGIGLAIVKQIVEAHGGEVGVESEVGRGSKFWFTLRAHAGSAQLAGP